MPWLRPDLAHLLTPAGATRPCWLDSAIFDVDGVLIDVTRSYRRSVMAATEVLVRETYGLREAPSPLLTEDDIAAFKRAGGFNNDWDLTQLLTGLEVARYREWQGTPLAEVPLQEWAAQAAEAARARTGGVAWMLRTVPETALPPREVARWAHDEHYWGAALVEEHYGHTPAYAPHAPGMVHGEVPLLGPTTLPTLVGQGITRFGVITGRVGVEVRWVLHQIAHGSGLEEGDPPTGATWYTSDFGRSPFAVVLSGDSYSKPDPAALVAALRALESAATHSTPVSAGIYVGDTADDLDLVLRYRAEAQTSDASLPPMLAVMVATGEEADHYRERGADIILDTVDALPAALEEARALVTGTAGG